MSDQLFPDTLLDYVNKTTEAQWSRIDPTYKHYFASASLDAALSELEQQLQSKILVKADHTTHQATVKDWIGDVTLAALQKRIANIVTELNNLGADNPSASYVMYIAPRSSGDLTFLGVYLYGLGIPDGLYDEKSGSA